MAKKTVFKVAYRKQTAKSGKTYYYTQDRYGKWHKADAEQYEKAKAAHKKFVNKSGTLTKSGQKYVDELNRKLEQGDIDLTEHSVAMSMIEHLQRTGHKYTQLQVEAMTAENELAIKLANTGFTVDDLAYEYDLDPQDLLNLHNWNKRVGGGVGDMFTDPVTGITYKLHYEYDGEVRLEQVGA